MLFGRKCEARSRSVRKPELESTYLKVCKLESPFRLHSKKVVNPHAPYSFAGWNPDTREGSYFFGVVRWLGSIASDQNRS
jgi:hypothetical protein